MTTPDLTELNALPTWRGVEGSRFIWHGAWADPEVFYKGHLFNASSLEWDCDPEDLEDIDYCEGLLEDSLCCGCGEPYVEGDGSYTLDISIVNMFCN